MPLLYPIFSHCLLSSLIIPKILFFVGRRVRPASPVGQADAANSTRLFVAVSISHPIVNRWDA